MNQVSQQFYIYDIETYRNCFLFTGKFFRSSNIDTFEISPRKNNRDKLLAHLSYLKNCNAIMVGYNNLGFDYPITHELLSNPYTFGFEKARQICNEIFTRQEYGATIIYAKDRIIPQLDLMKMNHFDNKARRTRLKDLQFAMRIQSVEDLPFDPNKDLTMDQIDLLIKYNVHDVVATEEFLNKNSEQIKMRQELIENRIIYGDVLNYSDVRIGVEYLIRKIGKDRCFVSPGKPRQTYRETISFKEIILPKIQFRTKTYEDVYNWFTQQKVYPNGSTPAPSLETRLAGIDFKFGIGGVHASVENKVFHSSDTHVIRDIDVSGMYVAVAIANGFYPEHLGQAFVDAYKQLQSDRRKYPKGTTMNALLKLAGNGVYGKSNDVYSSFYDPKYTFSVTVNGQLQLLQLVELLSLIPGVQIIQANTDGITAYIDRKVDGFFQVWCQAWEEMTSLKLEHVEYKSMWIRDVNNYLAQTIEGKMKRKGAYWYPEKPTDYDGVWNKDFSNMVVQKAVEKCLVYNYTPEQVVPLFTNKFDYMLRYKTTGSAKVLLGDKEMQKTLRYYVSTKGEVLKKIDKPKGVIGGFKRKNGLTDEFYLKIASTISKDTWDERIHTKNKSRYKMNENRIEKGRLVRECNNADSFKWDDVDYDYYIQEVKKLIVGA